MMISHYQRRTREVTGPTPASVAIKAKYPYKRPAEWRILERRKQEDYLKEIEGLNKHFETSDMKSEWEKATDKKIQLRQIRRRIGEVKEVNEWAVEDRRERLRHKLKEDEAAYMEEFESKEETTLERQAKMRERAKSLKERREAERLQFVQEKLDQQFREQCEELRSTLSKRQQDQVCVERLEQLRLKDEIAAEKRVEDAMYADLWEQDRLTKAAREEREAQAAHERNRETLGVLRKQMAALEMQKEEARRLRDEEAHLLKEQAKLRQIEEQQAREEKARQQREMRDMLDLSLKMKMKKKAREEQEQLAFDLKMMEQLLEESRNEAMEMIQRKKELREEDRRYREYLQHLMEEEKIKERELEQLIADEVEKMWQKRLDQWRKEREARKKLLADVMAGRAEQIRDRLVENERQQLDAQRERENLLRTIEENQRLELEQAQKLHQRNHQYQRDLQDQITYNRHLRDLEYQREEEELRLGILAERQYQDRLKEALNNAQFDKLHPMRRQMMPQQDV